MVLTMEVTDEALQEAKDKLIALNSEVLVLVKRLDKGISIIGPLETLKNAGKASQEQLKKLDEAVTLWQSLLIDYETKQTEVDNQKRELRIFGLTTRDINQLLSQKANS